MTENLALAWRLLLFPAQFETIFFYRSVDHLIDVTMINTIICISEKSSELRMFAF